MSRLLEWVLYKFIVTLRYHVDINCQLNCRLIWNDSQLRQYHFRVQNSFFYNISMIGLHIKSLHIQMLCVSALHLEICNHKCH